ncbi:sulfatase-like hydrolase/transferase [Bacillaceae bacterium SIJ1]|uniref:sulfatase-like hydrolase/transferase n=1 Tax=Litoribacterium kuwaitense TaxID=1398745 RepID=UPI0013EB185D|nr:sulfatase-like hydrolase/transferase [Litoribacterium kuwaitense]NGP45555.1 sulfatase-like hydrolase/transferase [Litoribacterium kuwaitense]
MTTTDHNKPNIVFIMSDDQGAWAMGCAGNPEVRTPNLDRLASTGTRFENFFCASPVCSPARASVLTGRIPSQHGVLDWIRSGNVNKQDLSSEMKDHSEFRDEKHAIDYLAGQKTYTEVLNENGYDCALSGKWHLGNSLTPQKGFSHWYTIGRGGCHYYSPDIVENGEIRIEKEYLTDLITKDALNVLDHHKEKDNPLYLSVHYTAPHAPWGRDEHPANIYDSYEACSFTSVPEGEKLPWYKNTIPQMKGQKRKEILQGYFAAITAMDQGIGEIIDKIEEMGIRENTLLIFMSDNGMSMGHHGIWGKGNGTVPQNMYDTAVKVPAIMSQPGHIPQGVVRDELLSQYDMMPTLLEYVGLTSPDTKKLPGTSFAPLLHGEEMEQRDNVVVFDEYGPVRMIRGKRWKYVHRYPYGPHELYDLENDPTEAHNLIDDPGKKDLIADMKSRLDQWYLQYADPERDGAKEGVTGSGQLGLAGIASKGEQVYAQD